MSQRQPRLIVPFLWSCAKMAGGLVALALTFGAFVDALVSSALHFVPAIAAFRAGMTWQRQGLAQPVGKRVAMAAWRAAAMVFLLALVLVALFLAWMVVLLATSSAENLNREYAGAALILAFTAPPVYVIYAIYALWGFLTCWAGLLLGHARASSQVRRDGQTGP